MYAIDEKTRKSKTTGFSGYFYSGGTAVYSNSLTTNATITTLPWVEAQAQHLFTTTGYPVYINSTPISQDILPHHHPAWIELEAYLNDPTDFDNVDPADDEAWLDNIRSSWSDRLDDLYETES